eukprot:scaffold2286_cov240-Pinguiococcus_pyrenoidosus.AAC.15
MGDSITEGVVVSWEKQKGDAVATDDVVVVLETDKVSVDVRSPGNGTITETLAEVEATVEVGAPLFSMEFSDGAPASTDSAPAADPPKSEDDAIASSGPTATGEETTIAVPGMGDSITEGTIISWEKSAGDFCEADDVVCVIETDKVSVDVRAPEAGTVTATLASQDDVVEVGAPLYKFQPGKGGSSSASAKAPEAPKQASQAPPPPPKKEEPASEPPSPPSDMSPPQKLGKPQQNRSQMKAETQGELGLFDGGRSETRVKMTRMRLRIAERLKDAQNTAAMLTTFQECDMSALMALRKAHKEEFEKKHGIKLGVMSMFVKAATAALQEVPTVNAYIDDAKKEIVYRNFCDVSVAVASPTGLVVPVLRNTETMSFADVEKNIAQYGKMAKEGT